MIYPAIFELKQTKSASINKYVGQCQRELESFFGKNLPHPVVVILKSREEINTIFGKKTEPWLVGWVRENIIFILSYKCFSKESSHPKHDFWKVLKHESCHVYFQAKTGINYPIWLNEGLACYLSGQIKKQPIKEDALRVFQYFKKSDNKVYHVGYFWVSMLIKKFGKAKFQKLIKKMRPEITEKQFSQIFKEIFGINYSMKNFSLLVKNLE